MDNESIAGGVNETDFEAINLDKNGNEITIADILKKSDEDYGFYLENGVCYLYFQQGEIAYNAAGSFRIKLAEYQ